MKGKFGNSLILLIIATGIALVALMGDMRKGIEPMQTLFLTFLAAIFTVLLIPAIMMSWCMIKVILGRPDKETKQCSGPWIPFASRFQGWASTRRKNGTLNGTLMDRQKILIVDSNLEVRKQIAESFLNSGYFVETTGSAAEVVSQVMKKQTEIVLLGVDFDENVLVTDLVRILKKCNRNLNIILVADKVPRVLERTVRQEGIFYHAFRPFNAEGREELRLVVECAFHNSPQAGLV